MNSNPRTNGVSQNRCFSRSDIRFFRTLSRGRDQFTSYIVRCKGQIGLKMYFLKLSHNMKCGMVFLPFCSSKWRQTCRCFGNTVNKNLYRTSFKLKHKTFWERGGGDSEPIYKMSSAEQLDRIILAIRWLTIKKERKWLFSIIAFHLKLYNSTSAIYWLIWLQRCFHRYIDKRFAFIF